MLPLTVEDVQQALDAFGFGITMKIFEQSTATSQLAADAIGCQLGQIAKSICFLVEDAPVLAVMSGDQLVDDRKIAAFMGVGRKKVRLAKPDDCLEVFGFMPGGVPPLGHRTPMSRVFLDHNLQRYELVYAAGGTANAIFPLTLPQLETVTNGTFLDFAREVSISQTSD